METLKENDKVIVSVLENFIEKAVVNAEEDLTMVALASTMTKFMDKIAEVSKRVPSARLVLAYPILRPANKWMTEMEDKIKQEFEKAFNTHCLLNISKVDAISRGSQEFDKDGVHLMQGAGKNFLANLVEMAEAAFEAKNGEEDDSFMNRVAAAAKDSEREMGKHNLQELRNESIEAKNWRKNLEKMLNTRFMNDNVMFARLRDEVDSEANRKKEDRTLVMGLDEPADLPRFGQERNERLKAIAKDFCKVSVSNFDSQIMFAATCGKPLNGKMRMEFRLESVELAREIRKIFAIERAAKQIKPELADLQVMTMVTLATRIRMNIMKSIAKRIETSTESAYVPNFLSRPIMHIKKKTKEGELARSGNFVITLTFVESVCLHGRALKRGDLDTAQQKARGHFRGTMRQHFLLLEEAEDGAGTSSTMWVARTNLGGGIDPGKGLESGKGPRGTKHSNVDGAGGSGSGKLSRK